MAPDATTTSAAAPAEKRFHAGPDGTYLTGEAPLRCCKRLAVGRRAGVTWGEELWGEVSAWGRTPGRCSTAKGALSGQS